MARSRRRRVAALTGLAVLLLVPGAAESGLIVDSFVRGTVTVTDGIDLVDPASGPELVVTSSADFDAGTHGDTETVDGALQLSRRGLAEPSVWPWPTGQLQRRCSTIPVAELDDPPVVDPDAPPTEPDPDTTVAVRLFLDTATELAAGRLDAAGASLRIHDGSGAELPIWVPDGVGTADTVIWTELSPVPTTASPQADRTLCISWGDPEAESVSSPIELPLLADGVATVRTWLDLGPDTLRSIDWTATPDTTGAVLDAALDAPACDRCAHELVGRWTPTVTGSVRFWLAAADVASLEISTSGAVADLTTVVELDAGTPASTWTDDAQRSEPIPVVAGTPVLVRVRQRDAGDTVTDLEAGPTLDHASVAVSIEPEEPPAGDPPADDPPVEDGAAEDPPAEDPPAEDPPAEDPPAEEAPAEDGAAEDPPTAEPEPIALDPAELSGPDDGDPAGWTQRTWLDTPDPGPTPWTRGLAAASLATTTTTSLAGGACDDCARRIEGWFVVPSSGAHGFAVAAGGSATLELSTTGEPADAVTVAVVAGSSPVDGLVTDGQMSEPIDLVAGQIVWFRAGAVVGDADHLQVYWRPEGRDTWSGLPSADLSSTRPEVAAPLTAEPGPIEGRRAATGVWTSPVYDLADTGGRFGVVRVLASLAAATDVEVRLASSDGADGPWAFTGPSAGTGHGIGDSLAAGLHDGRRFLRLQVTLAGDPTLDATPVVAEIGVRTAVTTVANGLSNRTELAVSADGTGSVDRVILDIDDLPDLDFTTSIELIEATGLGAVGELDLALGGATGSIRIVDGAIVAAASGAAPHTPGTASPVRLSGTVTGTVVLEVDWVARETTGGLTIVRPLRITVTMPPG